MTVADLALHARLGISVDLLAQAGVRRVTDHEARELLGVRHRGDLAGICYPRIDPCSGREVGYRIRRDNPEIEDGKPKNKYFSSTDRAHLYFPPGATARLTDPSVGLVLIESEKAALAVMAAGARAHRSLLAVALGGAWGWKGRIGKTTIATGARVDEHGPLPDLDLISWTARDVVIVLDGDAATNRSIAAARRGLQGEAMRRGARVRLADLPIEPHVNGPDDVIAVHGDAALWALIDGAVEHLVPAPSHPMLVARELVRVLYTADGDGDDFVLRDHRGDFYRWTGQCWPELDKRDVRAEAYCFLERASYFHPAEGPVPFAPSRRKIDDVIDALRAVVLVNSTTDVPAWTNGRTDPPAHEVIAMTNGLLHVPTRTLLPHTPSFFTHHALPFAFDLDAPPPTAWLAFLHELWPDDDASIDVLQEVFGYILFGDTRLQKIFLIVGPKRAGKGTIGRVLTGLLGKHHVAAPTLASLSSNFGLAPLIGSPLALISDARLSSRVDSKIVVERLLSISGEDALTVDRKYKSPWTGKLPTRFVVLTNELPRLSDASGALASRFVLLVLSRSFYGAENPCLTDQLLAEASAILNWALAGLDRLNARGYFVNPPSGADAIQELEDLASPVAAFVRDHCVLLPDLSIPVDRLWTAWKEWCEPNGLLAKSKNEFGRDLKAACPSVRRIRPRTSTGAEDESRPYLYQGIGIKSRNEDDEPAER